MKRASLQFQADLLSRGKTDRRREIRVEMGSSLPNHSGAESRQGKSTVEQLSEGRGQPAQATGTCTDTAEEEIIQASETSQCFPGGLVIPLLCLPGSNEHNS